MPYTLTSAEKAELRRIYIANINKLNEYLPEGQKLRADLKWFNSRINDPKEQRFYIKSKEINESVNKRVQLAFDVSKKLEHLKKPGHVYAFNRGVFTDMLQHNFDPKVQKFNEAMMREYYKNPEAYAQRRIQNVLKFDAGDLQKFYKSPDLKNYFLDFYEKHEEVLEDCMNLKMNIVDLKKLETVSPELIEHLRTVGNNYELVAPCMNAARLVKSDFYFTLPPLSEEQIEALHESKLLMDDEEYFSKVKETINANLSYKMLEDEYINTMDGFEKNNINIEGPGVLSKLSGTIKQEGQVVSMSPALHYSKNILGQGEDFKLTVLNEETVKNINKGFTKDYIKESNYKHRRVPESLSWAAGGDTFRKNLVYAYAMREKVEIGKIDTRNIGELAENIKGGWKETILRTTSKQYKAFITAMKKYDNEDSRRYHDKYNVYRKANDYLIHKGVKSLDDIKNLPHPGDKRAMLCWDVMDSFEKSIEPTESRFERGTTNTYSLEEEKRKGSPLFPAQKEFEDFELETDNQPSKKKIVELDQEEIEEFQELNKTIKNPSNK